MLGRQMARHTDVLKEELYLPLNEYREAGKPLLEYLADNPRRFFSLWSLLELIEKDYCGGQLHCQDFLPSPGMGVAHRHFRVEEAGQCLAEAFHEVYGLPEARPVGKTPSPYGRTDRFGVGKETSEERKVKDELGWVFAVPAMKKEVEKWRDGLATALCEPELVAKYRSCSNTHQAGKVGRAGYDRIESAIPLLGSDMFPDRETVKRVERFLELLHKKVVSALTKGEANKKS